VQGLTADIAAALGRPTTAGSIVIAVRDDGPAARAGLNVGDVILKVGDDDADAPRILNRRIADSPIGGTIALTVWRDGALQVVPITVGELPSDARGANAAKPDDRRIRLPARAARDDLGLSLGPVTEEIAKRLGLGSTPREGVAINDVVAHSVAGDHGVTAGSVLLDVDRTPVASPAEAQQRIDAARSEQRHFVLLLVQDQSGLRWVSLPLE
jgi:serine protease Do